MKSSCDESQKLGRCWAEWTAIIKLFANKKVRRGEISQESYQGIHGSLQQMLEDPLVVQMIDNAILTEMKSLSAPWINIDALANADKPILKDLVIRSDALAIAWSGRPVNASSFLTGILVCTVFVVVFALVLGQDLWSEVFAMLFDGPDGKVPQWLRVVERNRTVFQSWTLGGSLAIATALVSWFVFRPPRSY